LSPQTKTSDDLAATQSRYRAARKAFNEFDADDSGSIDVDELKALLKQFLQAKDEKEFDELTHEHMARADIDNTGTLTFSEFVTLYNLLTESQTESQTAQSTTTSA
jgi:Ca2+-binding EF-hand superfamily protein